MSAESPVSVVLVESKPVAVSLSSRSGPAAVTLISGGPRGPAGPTGAAGAPGTEYVQAVAASNWTVTHNLGKRPAAVVVYDSLDNEVEVGVRLLDLNTVEITMASPMAGRVVVT